MNRIYRRSATALLAAIALAGGAAVSATSASAQAGSAATTQAATSICKSATQPKLAARLSAEVTAALKDRVDSEVGLTVADPADNLTCQLHQSWHFYAASVIKVSIISALLLKVGGPSGLTSGQKNLAWLMITQSNNDAATALWKDVGGVAGMQVFLNKAGMRHTELSSAWGLTLITAQDEMTQLHVLTAKNKVLSTASRNYVLYLMANVIPSQRWGVPAGAPANVKVHVKNGWLPYPNADEWHVHSIGAFTGHDISYQIVILTFGEQTESYGINTVQAAARVINRELAG